MDDDFATSVLTRASLTVRSSTSPAVLPKGKGRTKKRKYQKSSSNLTASVSSDAISDLRRIWLAGDKASLVQQGFDNASTLASAEQSIAGLLLSEEVATVSAAVASVGIFWVLLGTALCFVVRIRRQKHQRQRRRSRADAAQTAMLDEMIRSELARGRTRPHCDGTECWTPTYANVPRHLVECSTVHAATDSADAENLYWSIPATISIQASNSIRALKRSPEANAERTDQQHRNCSQNPDRSIARTASRKPRHKSTQERRTTDRCSDNTRTFPQAEEGSGKRQVPGKDSSITATNVQTTQRSPALNAASRRGQAHGGVIGRECRLHQRRQDADTSQKKTELGLVVPTQAARHVNECMKIPESNGSFLPNQLCLVSSSNSNSNSNYCCSDVTNFQCRHHAREREAAAASKMSSCRSCVGLIGTDRGDNSAKHFNSCAPGNGCRSAALGCSQPRCPGLVPGVRALTNKPPVRFPKMGRSCLVMGELIRRDWIWKLGGGQPLGSVSICERRDHRLTSRDPEIPLQNI